MGFSFISVLGIEPGPQHAGPASTELTPSNPIFFLYLFICLCTEEGGGGTARYKIDISGLEPRCRHSSLEALLKTFFVY